MYFGMFGVIAFSAPAILQDKILSTAVMIAKLFPVSVDPGSLP